MIELIRDYQADRTPGTMTLEDGTTLFTMERPWLNNAPRVSCIPEGVYKLLSRPSVIVTRTSKGKYLKGWEVTEVEGRSSILLHIANFPHELEGCIAVGLSLGLLPASMGPELAVKRSYAAFNVLMQSLDARDEWYLEIKGKGEVK